MQVSPTGSSSPIKTDGKLPFRSAFPFSVFTLGEPLPCDEPDLATPFLEVRATPAPAVPLGETSRAVFKLTFVLLGFCVLLSCINLGQMWLYHHQAWNGARRSLEAENYLRYGYFAFNLAPMDNMGIHVDKDGKPKHKDLYWHHPPLTMLALSVFVAVLGEGETTSRLFGAALSTMTFLLFWLALRRRWGDIPTFYALAFLLFQPFYGSYLGFVNFEPMVLLCMALHVWTYERYLERRRVRDMLWVFLSGFLGAYADYPMFIFLFFFWLFTGLGMLARDRKNWAFHAWYVLAVTVTVLLVGFQLYLWKDDAGGFTHIFNHRTQMDGNNPLFRVLQRWRYYYGFFGPFLYAFSAYYLLDLFARILNRQTNLGDAITLSFGATGLAWFVAMKQGHWVHEYFIFYFVPFFAFAAGYGLFRFTRMLFFPRRRVAFAAGLVILILAAAWALPIIHMKRANPIFEYKESIYDMRDGKKYGYNQHAQAVTKNLHDNSNPTDKVLIGPGLDSGRFEFRYYLHRRWETVKNLEEIHRKNKGKETTRLILSLHSFSSSDAAYLLKEMNFRQYLSFVTFDLTGKDFAQTTLQRPVYEAQSSFHRLFTSLVYGSFRIEDDPLQSLDLGLKLDKPRTIEAFAEKARRGEYPATLIEHQAALANLALYDGKPADLKSLLALLTVPKEFVAFGDIELLGHRFELREDGRTELVLVFRPKAMIHFNYNVVLKLDSVHPNKKMAERLPSHEGPIPLVIPTSLWKPGMIYTYRRTLHLDPGPWNVEMKLDFRDPVEVVNPIKKDNQFPIVCKAWSRYASESNAKPHPVLPGRGLPGQLSENAAEGKSRTNVPDHAANPQAWMEAWIERQNVNPRNQEHTFRQAIQDGADTYLRMKELGQEFVSWGCYLETEGEGTKVRLLLSQAKVATRPWIAELSGKKGKEPKGNQPLLGFNVKQPMKELLASKPPNELFFVDFMVQEARSVSSLQIRLSTGEAPDPTYGKRKKQWVSLGRGKYGVRVPFRFLHNWIVDPFWD